MLTFTDEFAGCSQFGLASPFGFHARRHAMDMIGGPFMGHDLTSTYKGFRVAMWRHMALELMRPDMKHGFFE